MALKKFVEDLRQQYPDITFELPFLNKLTLTHKGRTAIVWLGPLTPEQRDVVDKAIASRPWPLEAEVDVAVNVGRAAAIQAAMEANPEAAKGLE